MDKYEQLIEQGGGDVLEYVVLSKLVGKHWMRVAAKATHAEAETLLKSIRARNEMLAPDTERRYLIAEIRTHQTLTIRYDTEEDQQEG